MCVSTSILGAKLQKIFLVSSMFTHKNAEKRRFMLKNTFPITRLFKNKP